MFVFLFECIAFWKGYSYVLEGVFFGFRVGIFGFWKGYFLFWKGYWKGYVLYPFLKMRNIKNKGFDMNNVSRLKGSQAQHPFQKIKVLPDSQIPGHFFFECITFWKGYSYVLEKVFLGFGRGILRI